MIRSLSLRTRCATASTRASAALAACDAPALADCAARDPVERALRALEERVERARLAVLPLALPLPLARRVPPERVPPERLLLLERLLLDLPLLDRLPPERDDPPPPDELPELDPLLLAWGIPSSLCNGPAHPTRRSQCSPALASHVHAHGPW
jgi:hypothetical protein